MLGGRLNGAEGNHRVVFAVGFNDAETGPFDATIDAENSHEIRPLTDPGFFPPIHIATF